jgi:hypothetical protein
MGNRRGSDRFLALALLLAACQGELGPGSKPGTTTSPPEELAPAYVIQGRFLGSVPPEDPQSAAILAMSPEYSWNGTRLRLYVSQPEPGDPIDLAAVPSLLPYWTSPADYDAGADLLPAEPAGWYDSGAHDAPYLEYLLLAGAEGTVFVKEPVPTFEGFPTAAVTLPSPANLIVPAEIPLGEPLVLDFGARGYHHLLVVVIDLAGDVTWSNTDYNAVTLEALNLSSAMDRVEVPGEAFGAVGDHLIGYAAMTTTFPSDFSVGIDDRRSAIACGALVWRRLEVVAGNTGS